MPCGFTGIDSGTGHVNGRPYCTATRRPGRALRIGPAGRKDSGHPLMPGSFSAFTKPQCRSGIPGDVPGVDLLEGAKRLEVNTLQDQHRAKDIWRESLAIAAVVHDQAVQVVLTRSRSP